MYPPGKLKAGFRIGVTLSGIPPKFEAKVDEKIKVKLKVSQGQYVLLQKIQGQGQGRVGV